MPQYSVFVGNQSTRIKYPRDFDVADAEAARTIALRIARVFVEVVPYWNDLSSDQQNDFFVEIADETGKTVLSVPFRETGRSSA